MDEHAAPVGLDFGALDGAAHALVMRFGCGDAHLGQRQRTAARGTLIRKRRCGAFEGVFGDRKPELGVVVVELAGGGGRHLGVDAGQANLGLRFRDRRFGVQHGERCFGFGASGL